MAGILERVHSIRYELVSFLLPFLAYCLTLKENIADTHVLNVLTQYALWTTGTTSLGTVAHPIVSNWSGFLIQISTDLVVSNGHYYSVYAPGMSFLSFPFGLAGFLLNGGVMSLHSWAILTDEGFVALCGSIASFVLYKVCRYYASQVPSLLASLTLAFGTIVWPFATELFDHDVAMLFSLLGVYLVIRWARSEDSGRIPLTLAGAGGSLAVASTVEYLSAFLVLPIILFIAHRRRRVIVSELVLLATFVAGPVLDLAYNVWVTGNPFDFPENLYGGANGLTAIQRFAPSQLLTVPIIYLVSPYRGLLLISPVLFVGLYGLVRMYKSGGLRGEAVFLFSLFLFGLVPYSAWTDWRGGDSFGPRFLVDVIPFIVIPIAYVLSEERGKYSRWIRGAFGSLFIYSSFIAGTAAFTTADPPALPGVMAYQAFSQSIPILLKNDLDVWWHRFHPHLALVLVPLCFISLWVLTVTLLSRKRIGGGQGASPLLHEGSQTRGNHERPIESRARHTRLILSRMLLVIEQGASSLCGVAWVLNRMDAVTSVSGHVRRGIARLVGKPNNNLTICSGGDATSSGRPLCRAVVAGEGHLRSA